jgi:hypothetical protein
MVAILAGYVFVYQVGPFSEDTNSFVLNLADPFAALLAAISLTAVLLHYRKEDKPYPIWLYFAIGMWAWVLAESIWSFIDFTSGEVPPVGIPDVFWLIGYALLSIALYKQYQLISHTKIAWWKVVAVWAGIMLVVLVGLFLAHIEFTLENFMNYLYPAIDFALCIAALRLFMAFGGGKLSRPWIGLFVMGISDFIWAWLNATGQYQASSDAGTWLSVFTDTTYVAAYLMLAIGFLMQYLLLRFGPE